MSSKRKASSSPATAPAAFIFTSSTINDRRSTFIAFYSPTASAAALQGQPELSSASHRTAAWRLPTKQTTLTRTLARDAAGGVYDVGHDDDGEQWAGKRLERLLQDEGVVGSLVVGRWYGGVLLGPVRFKHIEDCAKEAIARWREGEGGEMGDGKRRKTEGEAPGATRIPIDGPAETMDPTMLKRIRDGLMRELRARDESVTVLRELLRQKKAMTKKAQLAAGSNAVQEEGTSSPPAAVPDYSTLALVRLRAVEKARDATIAFLLSEITKAEEASALEKELEEDDIDDAWHLFDAATAAAESQPAVESAKGNGKTVKRRDDP
jgi:Uncharacterized protein family UPF0029